MAGAAPPGELATSRLDRAARGADTQAQRAASDGWSVDWATPGDDAGIRALLRRSVIPGAVRVAFTREPSDAAGAALAGSRDLTIVARNGPRIVGVGRCSIHKLLRNGTPRRVGYLSALRLERGAPASPRLLRDGYRALASAAREAGVDGFVTSIADDNDRARRVLEHGGRFGLPHYRALAPLATLVAPIARRDAGTRRGERDPAMLAESAREVDVQEFSDFLRSRAERAHLTLAWDADRWAALGRHGLTPSSFVVVRRNGAIAAAAAIWDQRAFRQTIVDGYEGALRTWRPAVNAWQRLRGLPRLPDPGATLSQGAVFGVSVADDRAWPALWLQLTDRARALSLDWLTITRDARAPELAILRRLAHARTYATTLYDVAWRDEPAWPDAWDGRLFAPEAGLL